jgi:hypothetical protein
MPKLHCHSLNPETALLLKPETALSLNPETGNRIATQAGGRASLGMCANKKKKVKKREYKTHLSCLVLSNTRRGWANVPRWGERQRRWLAALLPLP